MKKAISLLLALTLLTLAACGGQERTAPDGPEENPPAQVGGTDPADAPPRRRSPRRRNRRSPLFRPGRST